MFQKLKNFIWNDLPLRLSTLFATMLGALYFLVFFYWVVDNGWNFNIYIEPLSLSSLALLLVVFSIIVTFVDIIAKALKLKLKFKCLNNIIIKLFVLFFYSFYFIFSFISFCLIFLILLMFSYYFILDSLG